MDDRAECVAFLTVGLGAAPETMVGRRVSVLPISRTVVDFPELATFLGISRDARGDYSAVVRFADSQIDLGNVHPSRIRRCP